ncbi:MAG: lipid II flippase MurJ, partial [Candidatus Limnocylindrales bacterium]
MSRGALARAGLIVTGAFLASRILGWLRVVVLGNLFGSPDQIAELDAYYAAFRVPDLIFELVAAGAITSALIPVLSGLIEGGEKARAWRVASTVLNLML